MRNPRKDTLLAVNQELRLWAIGTTTGAIEVHGMLDTIDPDVVRRQFLEPMYVQHHVVMMPSEAVAGRFNVVYLQQWRHVRDNVIVFDFWCAHDGERWIVEAL